MAIEKDSHITEGIEKMNTTFDAQTDFMDLSRLTTLFARVERAPRLNGERENDVEHSFHLALTATEFAATYHPELDTGLVAQFSLVHDLPESITGDVRTLTISARDRRKKEAAEKIAAKGLIETLPKHTADLLRRYEEQIEPEARFVRLVDKLTPIVIHLLSGDNSTLKEDYGIASSDDFYRRLQRKATQLEKEYPEFPLVHAVHRLLNFSCAGHVYSDERRKESQEPVSISNARKHIGQTASKRAVSA